MDDGITPDKDETCEAEKDDELSDSDSKDSVPASPARKNLETGSQPADEVQDDWYTNEEKDSPPQEPDPSKQVESTTNKAAGDTAINGKKKIKEGKPFTKVVVRRLPPSMSKDIFLDQVSPLPIYDYFYFVPASQSSTPEYSRAYINFVNQEDLFSFTRTFDNYVFIDTKGHEYPALVEFAPYQRVPKQRNRKPDSLVGTIEKEAAFVAFKEELLAQAVDTGAANKQHYFETEISETDNTEVETTPLVEFVKARKIERAKAREERREERRRKEAERKAARARERQQVDPPDSPTSANATTSANTQPDVKSELEDMLEDEEDDGMADITIGEGKDLPTVEAVPVDLEVGGCKSQEVQQSPLDQCSADRVTGQGDSGFYCRRWYRAEWWSREPQLRLLAKGEPFPAATHPTYTVLQKEKKEPKEKEKKSKGKEDKFGKHPPETRTREFKNKGGKSYKEERLKQAERREEKKKKDEQLKEGATGGGDETTKAEGAEEETEERNFDKKKWKYEGGKGRTFRRREDKREGRGRGGGRSRPRVRGEEDEHDDEESKSEVSKEGAKDENRKEVSKEEKKETAKEENEGTKKGRNKSEVIKEERKVDAKEDKKNDAKEDKNTLSMKDEKKGEEKDETKHNSREEKSDLSKESSKDSQESQESQDQQKGFDPRAERRIRNKDRPSMEIYRPGMGKFSRQRLEKEKAQGSREDSPCHSPSPST